jgi:cytochrome d ubiquinol oxidase subunit II
MTLISFWFIVLVVFWTGFLVLEGFNFGVGMLGVLLAQTRAGSTAAPGACGA